MRAVSLLPSATELCYALGVEPVGVSHECDHPPAANDRPVVVHSRVDADASSTEIDEQVREAVATGGVYELDRERLRALDPDVILSQGVCEVCAVDDAEVHRAVADLGLDADIVTTDPHSLGDVFADLERIGAALDREERAREVAAGWRDRVTDIERTTPDEGPRVAVLDWLDPVMVAGHWVPGMVERVGGQYGLADAGDPSRPHEWADIREYDPEVLVAAPCGFDIAQTHENWTDLTAREGWSSLTAVANDRVYVLDGDQYVNRPGPRLVDTLELLAGILNPDHPPAVADRGGVRRLSGPADGPRV
jgi:iron complex transport system substrate-binding protein